MKPTFIATLFALFLSLALDAYSHCQIPCGIYGDDARSAAMLEDVTTLRKSVEQINEESEKENPNFNQLVRWVGNKETHADRIMDTVLNYYLAQRIKSDQPHYEKKLVALHEIVVLSMKVKQTSDAAVVDSLEEAVKTFQMLYASK